MIICCVMPMNWCLIKRASYMNEQKDDRLKAGEILMSL